LTTVKAEKETAMRLQESERFLLDRVEELEKQHARDQALLEMKTEKLRGEQEKAHESRGSMQSMLVCAKKKQCELENDLEECKKTKQRLEDNMRACRDELAEALQAPAQMQPKPWPNGDAIRHELTLARVSVGEAREQYRFAEQTLEMQTEEMKNCKRERENAVQQLRVALRTCADLRKRLESGSAELDKQTNRANQLDVRLKSVRTAKKATDDMVKILAKNVDQVQGQFGAMAVLKKENQRLQQQLRLETYRRHRGLGAQEQASIEVERREEQIQSLEDQLDRRHTEIDEMSNEMMELRTSRTRWEMRANSAEANDESAYLREETKSMASKIRHYKKEIEELKNKLEEAESRYSQKEAMAKRHARKSALATKSLFEANAQLAKEKEWKERELKRKSYALSRCHGILPASQATFPSPLSPKRRGAATPSSQAKDAVSSKPFYNTSISMAFEETSRVPPVGPGVANNNNHNHNISTSSDCKKPGKTTGKALLVSSAEEIPRKPPSESLLPNPPFPDDNNRSREEACDDNDDNDVNHENPTTLITEVNLSPKSSASSPFHVFGAPPSSTPDEVMTKNLVLVVPPLHASAGHDSIVEEVIHECITKREDEDEGGFETAGESPTYKDGNVLIEDVDIEAVLASELDALLASEPEVLRMER